MNRCPHPNCTWGPPPDTRFCDLLTTLRTHLAKAHPDTPPSTYLSASSGFHVCTFCDSPRNLYLKPGHLQTHLASKHRGRTRTNLQLVLATYRHLTPEAKAAWADTLQWLTHNAPPTPPFRTTLFTRLRPATQARFLQTLHNVAEWAIAADEPPDPNLQLPESDTNPTPFWHLLIFLEGALLAPPTRNRDPNTLVIARLEQFSRGDLKTLFRNVTDYPANTNLDPPSFDEQTYCPQAQAAADVDNLGTAFQRVRKTCPKASLTHDNLARLQPLFPPRRHYNASPPTPVTRRMATRRPPSATHTPTLVISPQQMARTAASLNRGTATGPFAGSIDTWQAFAAHTKGKPNPQLHSDNDPKAITPYTRTLTHLINIILAGRVPPTAARALVATHVVALHKDPNNLAKLRPLGIGSSLRRVACTAAAHALRDTFAQHFVPAGQYGVRLSGGIVFALHTTTLQIERYVEQPNPSRALLMLDITNMFNAVSRDACRHELTKHPSLQPLLPLFDLLYARSNHCKYHDPLGQSAHFLQHEGFAQGCPLSPAFACIVLTAATRPLNAELRERAAARLLNNDPGDDGLGSVAATSSIMDDTSIVISYPDLPWFVNRIATLGAPLGIALNKSKTILLTSTTGASPTLSPTHTRQLEQTLQHLSSSSENPFLPTTTGTRFLGAPVGGEAFARSFLLQSAQKLRDDSTRVLTRLRDTQTQSAIIRNCALPSINHLLAHDVYWSPPQAKHLTTFTSHVHNTALAAIATMAGHHSLNPLSEALAFLPVSLGGLGYRDAHAAAQPAFLASAIRSLRIATSGTTRPPTAHTRLFDNWDRSSSRLFSRLTTVFNHHFPPTTDDPRPLPKRVLATQRGGLSRALYFRAKELDVARLPALTPTESQLALPSLLDPLTGIPLHNIPRRVIHARIPPDLFRILLQRKLRLSLFPNRTPPACSCKNPIDPFGDHFFACRKSSKIRLHNTLRDTLHSVLHTRRAFSRSLNGSL